MSPLHWSFLSFGRKPLPISVICRRSWVKLPLTCGLQSQPLHRNTAALQHHFASNLSPPPSTAAPQHHFASNLSPPPSTAAPSHPNTLSFSTLALTLACPLGRTAALQHLPIAAPQHHLASNLSPLASNLQPLTSILPSLNLSLSLFEAGPPRY
jgi:hypothetical protein